MAGIDPTTGRFITGWPHVVMCVRTLFTTRIGSRERARLVGSAVPRLLGENLDEDTLFRYQLAAIVALTLWEKRLAVAETEILREQNQPEELRAGKLTFAMRCRYMPRAYLGDYTVAPGLRTLFVGSSSDVTSGVLVL